MSALFCIPRAAVEKLKQSALSGNVDIAKLYEMSSKQRRDFFSGYTDPQIGKMINTEFEKAIISQQQDAMTKWAQSVFKPEFRNKPQYKTITDKIKSLDDLGVLNPATEKEFLADLVSDKLGLTATPDEVRLISEKAAKIDAAQQKLGVNLGSPEHLDDNLAFFVAKKDMDDYLQSLNPSNRLQVVTGTIGRAMMLASVKSPLLNIGSNLEVGATEALVRRVAGRTLRGADNDLAKSYIKMANKVYQKSGYDITRMLNISDGGVSGARVLGDTVHAQGPGAIRKVGQVVEDTVFKQLMGAPDVAFASVHFADSVNLAALKVASGDKAAAREIMLDAMKLNPETAQGELVRSQAILDAQVATWTNDSWASKVSLGIRKILNEVSGDARVGDFVMPYVKTPANVISTGLDYAGLGIPKGLFTAVKAVRSGDIGEKAVMQKIGRDIVRGGLGLTAAAVIALQFKPEDFVGAYDPSRAQIEQLRNSNTNAVRIGNKWISLDWFGPLSIPMTAQLYAKKYGTDGTDKMWQYGQGAKSSLLQLPGLSDLLDYGKKQAYEKADDTNAASAAQGAKNYAISQAFSRLVPSFVSDIAKATDKYQRESSKGLTGAEAGIPGLREQAAIKRNIFGDEIRSENAGSTILFGSRVRTDKDTPLLKEIAAVSKANDKAVNFTDWKKSSASGIVQFKAKVGDKEFDKATITYGQKLKANLQKTVDSGDYKGADDEKKLALINKADAEAQKTVFNQYHFKPTRKKSLLSR